MIADSLAIGVVLFNQTCRRGVERLYTQLQLCDKTLKHKRFGDPFTWRLFRTFLYPSEVLIACAKPGLVGREDTQQSFGPKIIDGDPKRLG